MADKLINTDTLQAYLDTGYTPEQVKDMVFLYREKCQEVSRLRSELQVLKERDTAKMCKQSIFDSDSITCVCGSDMDKDVEYMFCPWCGQRLKKWEE